MRRILLPGHTFNSGPKESNLFISQIRRRRWLACVALLLSLTAFQAATVRADVASDANGASGTSSFNNGGGTLNVGVLQTVGTGANRVLIAGISITVDFNRTPPNTTGATWTAAGGSAQTMTFIGRAVANNVSVDLYALANPNSSATNGTTTISLASYSGNITYKVGSISYTGVDQTAPVSILSGKSCAGIVASSPCNVAVPTAAGSIIYAMGAVNFTSGLTPATHFLYNEGFGCPNCNNGGNGLADSIAIDLNAGSATSQTITASTSNGSAQATNNVAIGAVNVNPASASRTTPTGSNVQTKAGNVTLTFNSVTVSGTTSVNAIDPNTSGPPPGGYTFCASCPAYDITTTATYNTTGGVQVCLSAPNVTNPTTFSQLKLLHFETGAWVDHNNTSSNFSSKLVCGHFNSLSPFAIAQGPGPTAAPASIKGRVMTADGQPLAGVVLNLNGSQAARTITDNDGLYSFEGIDTGSFYTVAPERANYSFNPSARSFSLKADVADAVFTASPEAIANANPLDTDLFFVRQQYMDFLGREPDREGLLYWASELNKCGADLECLRSRRIAVAAAFFIEGEYQETGSFIYRLYQGALGRQVTYAEFSADRQQVIGGSNLDAVRAAFASAFVQRPEFAQRYAGKANAESFVDALIESIGQASGVDLSAQRAALLEKYRDGSSLAESRSLALRSAIDDAEFRRAIYNASFVQMQYFGYLKREPEQAGFDFWLNVLNNSDRSNYRGMVCSFITSAEYQRRFSNVLTHSNGECGH